MNDGIMGALERWEAGRVDPRAEGLGFSLDEARAAAGVAVEAAGWDWDAVHREDDPADICDVIELIDTIGNYVTDNGAVPLGDGGGMPLDVAALRALAALLAVLAAPSAPKGSPS